MADQNDYNRQLIEEFRSDRSKFGGRPLLLLTTTGAKSGQRRTTPMMYVRDGERLMVIASASTRTASGQQSRPSGSANR